MAVLGLPGGAELIVILAVVFLLFGPYLIVGWLSYRAGVAKGRAEVTTPTTAPEPAEEPVPPSAISESEDETRD